jgi:hypothetical protein
MSYKLYLDKSELFECDVQIKNASLKDAFARIIVESNDLSLMFPGKIKNGKCEVPIRRLKGLLEENSTGNISLEIVVEDTYFSPWKDKFVVDKHKDVKVKINEQKIQQKPSVTVNSVKSPNQNSPIIADLLYICERMNINKKNFSSKKNDFKKILKEYFKINPTYLNESRKSVSDIIRLLK